mgnify:CR=1 FL=1
MKRLIKLKKRTDTFLYDHIFVKEGISWIKILVISAFCAALYAFGFDSFITPDLNQPVSQTLTLVTGGVGGISQNIILITDLCGAKFDPYYLQSILYFAINIPIILFAFFAIGKKFAIVTAVNVGLSSLFVSLFKPFAVLIAANPFISGAFGLLPRSVFGAITISLASAIAFKFEISCGGIDVFSYYFSMRKSTSVGKFNMALNVIIILLYSILSCFSNASNWTNGIISFFCSIVYLFVTMLIIDFINIRNKKVQIQIITESSKLNNVLLANFPHGITIYKAIGGYSEKEKHVLTMIVSSFEASRVIKVAKKCDPHSFITVTSLVQVYGNFFIKPVE